MALSLHDALADRLGDARFMDVLREHNAIVREQVKAHGGFEVKSEGDGFMVAFQSAGKAVACASAIQRALVERNQSAEEPVLVRMGLHAGEVIKEGEDFFGRNVVMAARSVLPVFRQAELVCDGLQHELRVSDWRQVHHEDGLWQLARQVLGDRQPEAGLAYSRGAGQGNETCVLRVGSQ